MFNESIALEGLDEKYYSQRQLAWRRFRRNKAAMISAAVLLVLVLSAVFAPLLSPYGFAEQDLSRTFEPPS
ncbi:MAG: hypothetical protein IH940_07960, partial [Acidobacteria bacterium]|nr:hypothetical protein [Acidobacteriota bacterium]